MKSVQARKAKTSNRGMTISESSGSRDGVIPMFPKVCVPPMYTSELFLLTSRVRVRLELVSVGLGVG